MRNEHGYTLLEIIATLAVIGLLLLITVPAFATYRRHASVRAAAFETMAMFREVRQRAITTGRQTGVKFTRDGDRWTYARYEDGDGDGVRNDDIRSGIDHRLGPSSPLMPQLLVAKIGLLPYEIHDPDDDVIAPTDEPVAFNRSAICSFSPLGSGTPGSIYIIDETGELFCVRVVGSTGRARFLRYNSGSRRWEPR